MSIATTQATAVSTPSSKRLQRLVVAAGSYLGKDAGDSIPVDEVRLQADANGYEPHEIDAMLEADGLSSADELRVPEQGHLFGELWAPPSSGVPSPSTPTDNASETLDTFREWCRERAEKEASHSYTRKRANRRFARAKDVDRHFIKEYDTFSTVLITYDAGVPIDESVAEHAERFYPRAVRRKRTAILKELDVLNSYAGVALLAPKKADRVPQANTPYSHAHTFLWIPGEVSAEDFHPLVKRHIKHVEGATEGSHPLDKTVKVKVHDSAKVETPDTVMTEGSGLDKERGATTALPQELGRNLPLQKCQFDARGAPSYIERWCAYLRLGRDEQLSSRGLSRFQKLGSFKHYANSMKWRRRFQTGARQGKILAEVLME
ncbi:hypothetical protein ACOZ4F_14390 [Haloarcula marismortui]|uniref:hypothetical protein n=1 Tax=Haloarcula marismortui TaxID=2238 RepID=UPI003C718BBC